MAWYKHNSSSTLNSTMGPAHLTPSNWLSTESQTLISLWINLPTSWRFFSSTINSSPQPTATPPKTPSDCRNQIAHLRSAGHADLYLQYPRNARYPRFWHYQEREFLRDSLYVFDKAGMRLQRPLEKYDQGIWEAMAVVMGQMFGVHYDATVVHLAAENLDWAPPGTRDEGRKPADWMKKETDCLWWSVCDPKKFSVCDIIKELRTLNLGDNDYHPLEVEKAISYWQRRGLKVPEWRLGEAPTE